MSDLHLEFAPFAIPELLTDKETVLLLAGDIHVGARTLRDEWMINLSNRFAYVLYVLGNHEHYKESTERTANKIRKALAASKINNVYVLDNETFILPGTNYKIFGGTGWTDFNKQDPITMYTAQRVMSDYKKIRTSTYSKPFTPIIALGEHRLFKLKLAAELAVDDGFQVIVMTHHAPHSLSVDSKHIANYHMNGCYHSDFSELILDNTKIKMWCHGHLHNNSDYNIGDDCRVLCMPRGYYGIELNHYFDPTLMIKL